MSQHTKGPWYVNALRKHQVSTHPNGGPNTLICDTFEGPWEDRECLANARLIAEAPAMRAALDAAIECFKNSGTLSDAVVAQSCEVLARVDGEST